MDWLIRLLSRFLAIAFLIVTGVAISQAGGATSVMPQQFKIMELEVDDLKSVFATVRSKDRIEARVRTPGTVTTLKVDEGAQVEPGQVLALVADPKIAIKIKSLEAQIVGLESRVATAKLDYGRAEQLLQRGVTPRARVDQLRTAFEVATNELKSAQAERQVAEEEITEGQILAPAAGRVLKVPVTVGSVVMAGESIATLAANQFLLRLELPERHARFMKKGDHVRLGARGLAPNQNNVSEGLIIQVYPELQGGRVLADAEVAGLGDYFVGERALVWISVGKRNTIVIPADYAQERFGLDYVRLWQNGNETADIVVQLGRSAPLSDGKDGIEVLAGLKAGDTIVRPVTARP
jgi:RND family efflux transporter MFP subunit